MDRKNEYLLAEFIRDGSEKAFTELVELHLDLVSRVVQSRVRDREACRDLTQEVFALLARKARSLSEHPSIEGWLVRTAIFLSKKHCRREINRMKRERDYEQSTRFEAGGEELSQQVSAMFAALAELPAKKKGASPASLL